MGSCSNRNISKIICPSRNRTFRENDNSRLIILNATNTGSESMVKSSTFTIVGLWCYIFQQKITFSTDEVSSCKGKCLAIETFSSLKIARQRELVAHFLFDDPQLLCNSWISNPKYISKKK